MSDEKQAIENNPNSSENPSEGAHPEITATKPSIPMAVVLVFLVIAVLLLVLIVTQRIRPENADQTSKELTEMEAKANALRNQLNQELIAQGLRPMEQPTESIEDIASRLRKDTDTIVSLSGSFQSLLAEKDAALLAANSSLLRSEEQRQVLAMESLRLRTELQQALADGSQAELLRTELAATKAQRDTLAAELNDLRNQPPITLDSPSPEQERQLEEALRAKDFFETRAKQLEAELEKSREEP